MHFVIKDGCYLKHASEMRNAKIRRFTSRVNFVENNQIIIASSIQKFSTHVTVNKLSANNGLTP